MDEASRRDQIVDAAVGLVGGGGLRSLTHRAVDRRAGLPAGTTSNYFRTKDALVEAVLERLVGQFYPHFHEVLNNPPTTVEGLVDEQAGWLRRATESAFGYVTVINNLLVEPLEGTITTKMNTLFNLWALALTRRFIELGSSDPELDGQLLMAYMHGLATQHRYAPGHAPDPVDALGPFIRVLLEDRRQRHTTR